MCDMFTHELTVPAQWTMSILPNFFTKFEVRYGRFGEEGATIEPSYDPMCVTIEQGCYPILVIDPEKLVDPVYGITEARKLAVVVNGTEGFDEWMIEEQVRYYKRLMIEKWQEEPHEIRKLTRFIVSL